MTQTTLLVFARSAGLMFRAPGFTHPAVPMIVRLALALALALGITPAIAVHRELDPALLGLAVAGEVAIGAAIGIGASLLYDGAYYGGRMIDDYVGFRGSVPNAAVTSAQGFGRLWSALFLAGFFLLDGDAVVIRAFAESFDHVGAGALIGSESWYRFALALPQTIAKTALLVAAPGIAVAAVVQIALAAVTRVVPRFSSFTLSFPIVFAAALLVAIATLPLYGPLAAHPLMLVPYGGRP
ncbi:MAG: flagellar biosynthetic protein FliR [Candidatus Velthaea sp.]|jgi:flagellar biosynthesis protein FliR